MPSTRDDLPNLNSPPGAPIPNAPPSSANIAPLTTPPTTITSPTTNETQPQTIQTAPSSTATPSTIDPKSPGARKFITYSTLGATIAIPIIALLPPRKFDLYTFGLGVTWCVSTGFVLEERTGKGLVWHVGSRIPSQGNRERKAREALEKAEAASRTKESERGIDLRQMAREDARTKADLSGVSEPAAVKLSEQLRENEEYRKREERAKAAEAKSAPRGVIKKIWMGDESDDWIENRAKKEKEALEEGKGYGGLIGDYVREAFGFKNEEDDEDAEEEEAEAAKRLSENAKGIKK